VPAVTAPAASPAPAAPAGAVTEMLVLSSSPSGARITLNGVDVGKSTPQALPLNPGRTNTVQLSMRGYQTLTATISEEELRSGNNEFTLVREAAPVRLSVSAAYAFELVQGGSILSPSATRHEVLIAPGSGPVTARNKELVLNSPVPVDFQRGQVDVTLPNLGALTVFAKPETCSIVIDGQDQGFPPIPSMKIASGSHTVAMKCPDGKTDTQKVVVGPGEKLTVRLEKPKGD
jgi:hypothetical protein